MRQKSRFDPSWFLVPAAAVLAAGCAAGGMGGMGGMGGCGMGGHGGHGGHETAAVRRAICPVCGTEIVVGEKTPRATYREEIFYFVSEEHERLFLAQPETYLDKPTERKPPAPPDGEHQHH